MGEKLVYNPQVFEQSNLAAARQIILTPQDGQDTEERWVRETPCLGDLLAKELDLREGELLIDYGCGIGRMAKELIARTGRHVVGVDLSVQMRSHAPLYVDSSRFSVVPRSVLQQMVRGGLRADKAITVWVLQHCLHPPRTSSCWRPR